MKNRLKKDECAEFFVNLLHFHTKFWAYNPESCQKIFGISFHICFGIGIGIQIFFRDRDSTFFHSGSGSGFKKSLRIGIRDPGIPHSHDYGLPVWKKKFQT